MSIYNELMQAGTTNPTVALFIVELTNTDNRQEVAVPLDKVNEDHILGTVFWINDATVGAIWMNRRQNRGVFVAYDTTTFAMNEVSSQCSQQFDEFYKNISSRQ